MLHVWSVGRCVFRSFLLVAFVAAASRAAAQQDAQSSGSPTAGWEDGFVVQSPDGDYRLLVTMVGQVDGRFSLDDEKATTSTFTIRKVRPTFSGRVARYFEFRVMPDFGNGATVLQDMYFDIRFSRAFRVRSGKDKTPVGYEMLIRDAHLLFPERALASSLMPNRDVGVQVQGDLRGGKLSYSAGVFNGIPDGTSSTSELDTNDGKDVAARVVVQPFRSSTARHALSGLGIHLGGSSGKETGALPSFKTSVGQTYFSYADATADGSRRRLSPAVFYYYKAVGAFAEYMRSTQFVARQGVRTMVTNSAWEVTGSLVLTGEAASDHGVRPNRNFDPAAHRWGALQLLGRYTALAVDRRAFTAGLAAPGASREARSFTIAANWYPNAFIKYYATFERTVFDPHQPGARRPEDVILFRAQVGF